MPPDGIHHRALSLRPVRKTPYRRIRARKWVKDGREVRSYEWVRYCSLPDVRVVGGMGKILEEFISQVRPDDIMTYSDPRWSDGDAYKALGFVPEGEKDFGDFKSVKLRLKLTDYD